MWSSRKEAEHQHLDENLDSLFWLIFWSRMIILQRNRILPVLHRTDDESFVIQYLIRQKTNSIIQYHLNPGYWFIGGLCIQEYVLTPSEKEACGNSTEPKFRSLESCYMKNGFRQHSSALSPTVLKLFNQLSTSPPAQRSKKTHLPPRVKASDRVHFL